MSFLFLVRQYVWKWLEKYQCCFRTFSALLRWNDNEIYPWSCMVPLVPTGTPSRSLPSMRASAMTCDLNLTWYRYCVDLYRFEAERPPEHFCFTASLSCSDVVSCTVHTHTHRPHHRRQPHRRPRLHCRPSARPSAQLYSHPRLAHTLSIARRGGKAARERRGSAGYGARSADRCGECGECGEGGEGSGGEVWEVGCKFYFLY